MESQESDICAPELLDDLLADAAVSSMVQSVQNTDWSKIMDPSCDPTGELPARNEWTGDHFFDAMVDYGSHKKNYYLSTKLNRVYVDMGKVVPIQIKWDGTPGLNVRALMVFTEADNFKIPVRRCITHRDKDDSSNDRYDHPNHVLACENENAQYEVDPKSNRHSVLVPLHLQQGSDHALVNLKFMCKTSCPGGLNRSHTDVIFTLEDDAKNVLGRQKIGIKICSCPKRDKEKDESMVSEPAGKRKVKVKKEEKSNGYEADGQHFKKIKMEYSNNHTSSFMVSAVSPEVANNLKDHIAKWECIKRVEWAHHGLPPGPLVHIIEDIAVLPQPYL